MIYGGTSDINVYFTIYNNDPTPFTNMSSFYNGIEISGGIWSNTLFHTPQCLIQCPDDTAQGRIVLAFSMGGYSQLRTGDIVKTTPVTDTVTKII